MSATIASWNPYATTNSSGLFNTQSGGLRQGTAYPDPGLRWQRRTSVLASDETFPMWGGVGIYENIPGLANDSNANLGPVVGRATALTGSKKLVGFSVFDGAYGMVITPQSNVPTIGSGGQVMSYRLGSGMRIAVKCDPILAAALQGGTINPNVSWDFTEQLLIPYTAGAYAVNSTGSSYNSTTGIVTLKLTTNPSFSAGDGIIVDTLTGTGGDLAEANGTFEALTVDQAADTVTYQIATGLTITTITGGGLNLGSGATSALPVAVLEFQIGNSMTVNYDDDTGVASYNFDGNAAIIQL